MARWWLGLGLVSGCVPAGTAVDAAWIEGPDRVVFDGVPLAARSTQSVTLTNAGTAVAEVEIAVTEPFSTPSTLNVLDPGESTTIVVAVTADSLDLVSGVLSVAQPFQTLRVPLLVLASADADLDGALSEAAGGDDCDDLDPAVAPGFEEVCDDLDNDCDRVVDEGC